MTYMTAWGLGPEATPQAIKKIIILTVCASVGASLLDPFFSHFFNIVGPGFWFSLSWWGITHFLLWQPVTFLFVQGFGGITLSFLLVLFFNMYILWALGSQVLERVGRKSFLALYFTSGVLAGIISLIFMALIGHYGFLAGATPAVLAVLVTWTLIYPETELLFFFLFPLKSKWLTAIILGSALLIDLSALDFVAFVFHLSGAIAGYFFALIAWGMHAPFVGVYGLELLLISCVERLKAPLIALFRQKKRDSKDKIISINGGDKELSDEKFVDAMLGRISRYGRHSLTWQERERLDEIARRKKDNTNK